MDDSSGSRASRHPPPRRAPAPDAPTGDWSPAYQSPYDEQPERPHHQQQQQQQHHHQQPSYYASLFSAYRDDPATTNPPSPTSPNTHGYRPGDFATTASASTFSSPGGSWEQWPPTAAAAGPAASTWKALQNELSMLQQFGPNDVQPPPPPTVPFCGMRTPPPTGRVPPAEGAFSIQSHHSSPQFWSQSWSMPGGGERLETQPSSWEQALPPPQQRTRYSVAGVILDEEDFLDYATSSLDWLDSAAVSVAADQTPRAQQQQVPSTSSLPRLDLNYPISETKAVSPTMYMQLLSPLESTRPASAPPENSRRPRPSTATAATGHSGAIEQEDCDVFYQITNRRRSSSIDATMARAAAASSTTTADPLPVDESSYSRPPPHPRPQHRASMRGWVHYERRSSMASLDDPNPSSAAYLSSVPYPPPRPGTPTRPSAAARQGRRASAAASSSSFSSTRRPSAAITESGSPNTSPSRSGGGGRHHRPSSLSFVNFSSADAPKLMKAVSKSGGVAKHKRGPPPESRKGDHPHL